LGITPTTRRLSESLTGRSVVTGLAIGAGAVIFGALTAVGGPVVGFGALIGLCAAAYILVNMMAGLYLTVIIMALLPFATLPVKIALTPTLIDCAIGAFIVVYLFQWMTGRRTRFRFVPAHLLIIGFMIFMTLSFVAGLGHAPPTTAVLRRFAEMLLSILFAILLVDVVRDVKTLRRVLLLLIVAGSTQAVAGIGLVLINDQTAERILNSLGRFGYPVGGVIRYVEENPLLAERAIGTWVDPNAYGGFMLIVGVLAGVQILSSKPVTGSRWLAVLLFAPIGVALLLSQSRSAFVALGVAALIIAVMRYRWIIPVMLIAAVAFFVLPFTRSYSDRLLAGLNNQDLATQMRFGEYKDAFILIGRYPLIGVGYTGAPDRDIYLGVSSMYLSIAGRTGLVGLTLFLLVIAETFRYGLVRWRRIQRDPLLVDNWLGLAAALAGAMIVGIFDHFMANIEFNGSVLSFWMIVGLTLAAV
jgi:O-antigen ligase